MVEVACRARVSKKNVYWDLDTAKTGHPKYDVEQDALVAGLRLFISLFAQITRTDNTANSISNVCPWICGVCLSFNRCLSAGTAGHVLSPLHDHIIERFSIAPHLSGILELIAPA
jgi:hypothetical protein